MGVPDAQATLDFIRLCYSLFNDAGRLEEDAHLFQAGGNTHNILRLIDIVFREIAVQKIDASLVVLLVRRHIVHPDPVIDGLTRATYGGDDVISHPQFMDVVTDFFDYSERFMADDQVVIARGRVTVEARDNFLIGSVHSDPEHLDQDPSAASNGIDGRLGNLAKVGRMGHLRVDSYRFHECPAIVVNGVDPDLS
jgi:hypothetical protein